MGHGGSHVRDIKRKKRRQADRQDRSKSNCTLVLCVCCRSGGRWKEHFTAKIVERFGRGNIIIQLTIKTNKPASFAISAEISCCKKVRAEADALSRMCINSSQHNPIARSQGGVQLSKSSWELVPRLWQAPVAAAATMSPHFPSQQCDMKTDPVKGFTSGSRRSGSARGGEQGNAELLRAQRRGGERGE